MSSMSRAGRFTVGLSAIAVATIAAMTCLMLWHLRAEDLRRSERETVVLSEVIAEQKARSFQSVGLALDLALNRIAEARKLGISLDQYAMHAMLRSRIEGIPQLRSMFIVDADGRILSSALTHPAPAVPVGDRDYFTAQRDRPGLGLYVGLPALNRVDNKMTLFFSRRLASTTGEFLGIVVASLDLVYIESVYELIGRVGVSPVALHLADGTLIVRSPHDKSLLGGKAFLPTMDAAEEFATVRTGGADPGVTTYRKISGFPMVLSVGHSDREGLAEWRTTAGKIIAAALINIAMVLAITSYALRRQRREAELAAAAHESDEQLRAMIDSAMDAIITIDSDRRIVVFNPAAQTLFGYSLQEMLGSPLERLLPERFRAEHERHVAEFSQSDMAARTRQAHMEVIGRRADGTEFPIESTISKVTIGDKALLTAILRDVTERHRAERELSGMNAQLRQLAASLQQVREDERTAIARELHDELGQQLLRLRMDLDWLASRLRELAPALHDKAVGMKTLISGTVDALRHVTTQLRPPLLDELGLAEAVRWQLDEFARRTGVEVEQAIDIGNVELGQRIAINVFRIMQESLTNVARHAGATRVTVSLTKTEERLLLAIVDNGHGMDLHGNPVPGHGLVGIRERTLLLGGQMELASAPGKGFAIRVRIPLCAPESEE